MDDEKIESCLNEERLFLPPAEFSAQARIPDRAAYDSLVQAANEDLEGFWAARAKEEISWHKLFTTVLDRTDAPHYRWFGDGLLNVSFNCLDRHLEDKADQAAIIFEGEPGGVTILTYRQLHRRVCRFANVLKAEGVQAGDRVVIYLPMVPEAVIAMQACARIGAIHSVVFGGFSAESLKGRIEDVEAKLLITADGGHRSGRIVALKAAADRALESGCRTIQRVMVLQRTGHSIPMSQERDRWWHEAEAEVSEECEPTWVGAEHPLYLLYTSGSTGKPKGIQHTSAGYLLGTITTMKWVFDIRDGDVFWCTADVGWVTGHSYVVYGPLAVGTTIVMYEGAPTYPEADRLWQVCQDHGVTIFYTAPTAIRALMKLGDHLPASHDLSRLRLLGSVGEPINPEAWLWYYRIIGGERCPIVDTWWQTETGVHMIAPFPGAIPAKPGSCTLPLPGIAAEVVDEKGDPVTASDRGGYLVITQPWPAMLRTIWGDEQRYRDAYWSKFGGQYYLSGDSARRDEDGYFWIMGRADDVLNVSGHRLGTMEIESALVAHPRVAEAAVVGRPDVIKGEAIFVYAILKGARPAGGNDEMLSNELRAWVVDRIGAIAKPDDFRYVDNLPKTRSGKIMRRLLRSIVRGEVITQDTSTLESEAVFSQLRGEE